MWEDSKLSCSFVSLCEWEIREWQFAHMAGQPPEGRVCSCGPSTVTKLHMLMEVQFLLHMIHVQHFFSPSSSLQLMPTSWGLNSKELKFGFMTECDMKAWDQGCECTISKSPSWSLPPGCGCAVLCPDLGAAHQYYAGLHQLYTASVKKSNSKVKRFFLHANFSETHVLPCTLQNFGNHFPFVQQHLI